MGSALGNRYPCPTHSLFRPGPPRQQDPQISSTISQSRLQHPRTTTVSSRWPLFLPPPVQRCRFPLMPPMSSPRNRQSLSFLLSKIPSGAHFLTEQPSPQTFQQNHPPFHHGIRPSHPGLRPRHRTLPPILQLSPAIFITLIPYLFLSLSSVFSPSFSHFKI